MVLDAIGRLDVWVSSITMFSIVCISIWGVVTRYFLGNPAGWVGELSLALFVWLTFFGTSILARRGEIVNIEFLLGKFPPGLSFLSKDCLHCTSGRLSDRSDLPWIQTDHVLF